MQSLNLDEMDWSWTIPAPILKKSWNLEELSNSIYHHYGVRISDFYQAGSSTDGRNWTISLLVSFGVWQMSILSNEEEVAMVAKNG